MGNEMKLIIALLIVIVVLGGIFGLKVAGIIKPIEIKTTSIENKEVQTMKDINYNEPYYYKLTTFITANIITIIIISFIVMTVVNVGIGRLYSKLLMPEWISVFYYLFTPLILILGFINSSILNFIIEIISFDIMSYYFMSLGMSRLWPLLPIGSMIIITISFVTSFSSYSVVYEQSASPIGKIGIIIGIIGIIIYTIVNIIASIRLAEKFEKGIIFKIGLVLLPFIFKPILGFQKD